MVADNFVHTMFSLNKCSHFRSCHLSLVTAVSPGISPGTWRAPISHSVGCFACLCFMYPCLSLSCLSFHFQHRLGFTVICNPLPGPSQPLCCHFLGASLSAVGATSSSVCSSIRDFMLFLRLAPHLVFMNISFSPAYFIFLLCVPCIVHVMKGKIGFLSFLC